MVLERIRVIGLEGALGVNLVMVCGGLVPAVAAAGAGARGRGAVEGATGLLHHSKRPQTMSKQKSRIH